MDIHSHHDIIKKPDKATFVNFLVKNSDDKDIMPDMTVIPDDEKQKWERKLEKKWIDGIKEDIFSNLYDVLFIKQVKNIANELCLFFCNWEKILNNIKDAYPETRTFIERIQYPANQSLFSETITPWISTDHPTITTKEYILLQQEQSISELFSQDTKHFIKTLIREPFLSYVKTHLSREDFNYINGNFKLIDSHDLIMVLQTTHENHYKRFEENYCEILEPFVKSIWWKWVDYNIRSVNEKLWGIDTKQKIEYEWKSFKWEVLKSEILTLALNGENMYIRGEPGSGKTHLMQWLLKELSQTNPQDSFIYMTWREFYNEYLSYVGYSKEEKNAEDQKKALNDFKKRFRGKILILDGIEGIFAWKRLWTKETFLSVTNSTNQIIFTWRHPLKELNIPRAAGDVNIFDELDGLEIIQVPTQEKAIKTEIIQNIFRESATLFTQTLPIKEITNMLIDHCPVNYYKSIIRWYLRGLKLQGGKEMSMKEYIEINVGTNIQLPVGDIMVSIQNFLLDSTIGKEMCNIEQNTIDLDLSLPVREILKRIKEQNIKLESSLGLFLGLITYYIREKYPEKSREEIALIVGKSNASNFYHHIKTKLQSTPRIKTTIDNRLFDAVCKKYWFSSSD